MKGYKGFDSNWKCRDKQYAPGQEYEEETARLCDKGMHFVENPADLFLYYPPAKDGRVSHYAEVEADSVDAEIADDSKRACSKLKIGVELSIAEIAKTRIEYTKAHCSTEHTDEEKATAGDRGAATAGNYGAAIAGDFGAATVGSFGVATAGHKGVAKAGYGGAATAGDRGAATAGNYGAAIARDFGAATVGSFGVATAGHKGVAKAGYGGAATAGGCGAATAGSRGAATVGDFGAATVGSFGVATAGHKGVATAGHGGSATAGGCGVATSRGSVSVGINGLGLVRGEEEIVMARGGVGAILIIAVEDNHGNVKDWKSFVVDGEIAKPNTWYTLKNGEIVEVGKNEFQRLYRTGQKIA